MNLILKKQLNAEITIEAAIIVPIVMLVVTGMLYMTMYVHDVIEIKSQAYQAGVEYAFTNDNKENILNKMSDLPLFVVTPIISVSEEVERYVIKIRMSGKGNVKMINYIVNSGDEQKIYIQKKMSREILYGSNVLIEELEKRKGSR
jgi:H+/gluconate symporter-like permease